VHDRLSSLLGHLLEMERAYRERIGHAPDQHTCQSTRNLIHYTALRDQDLRELQRALVSLGLSSLGRCESWVLGSVASTLRAASALCDAVRWRSEDAEGALTLEEGRALLEQRTDALFGPKPADRGVRIMVTMPDGAAETPDFIEGCLGRGMDAMRINTASGEPETWLAMIDHLRRAERRLGKQCHVLVDLAGPKVRVTRIHRRGEERDRVRLRVGDRVRLALDPGAQPDTSRATVYGEPRELLAEISVGQGVWFDDGKIGAEVEATDGAGVDLLVTFAKPAGQRLRIGKGINVPGASLELPALTGDDRDCLDRMWGRADAFALSFVRSPEDVRAFREATEALQRARGGDLPAAVLKLETRAGFERLPSLLLELLRLPVGGLMIARGDLAVECGFERMAEIQEETLCFCEAAHVPVIWATEVLSTLAKRGKPTRAEITDAAAAQRAECVMLNKGPEIQRALATLADILRRMQTHQRKKTPMFRPLSIATVPSPCEGETTAR